MNDSLDLRNRILKMRESNNLNVTKQDPLKNNLMSEFESNIKDDKINDDNIKDDNKKEIISDKETVINQSKEKVSNSSENNSENYIYNKNLTKNQNITRTVNDNDAQFLMLANKFNEAVEVILELSNKVEKLERNAIQNKHMQNNKLNSSSFFNFKLLVFIFIFPLIVLGFFTLPFDLSVIKSIIFDILSSL